MKSIIFVFLIFISFHSSAQNGFDDDQLGNYKPSGLFGSSNQSWKKINERFSCPFKKTGSEVKNLWDKTKGLISYLASNSKCPEVAVSANNLQKVLANEKNNHSYNDDGVTLNNYDDIIETTYSQDLSLLLRDLLPDDSLYANCNTPNTLIDVKVACMEKKKIEILAQTKARLEKESKIFAAKNQTLQSEEHKEYLQENLKNQLVNISSYTQQLIKSAETCNNTDIASNVAKAGVGIIGGLASPYVGPFGAMVADGLVQVVDLLINIKKKQSLKFMENEEDFEDIACLYYESQVMRCEDLPIQTTMCKQNKESTNITELSSIIEKAISPENKSLVTFTNDLKKPLNSLNNKSILATIQEKIIPVLQKNPALYKKEQGDDKNKIEQIKSYISALDCYQDELDSFLASPENKKTEAAEKVNSLEKSIKSNSLYSIFQMYLDSTSNEKESGVLVEALNNIFKISFDKEKKISAISSTNDNDIRKKSQITSLLVSNIKETFTTRLKSHYLSDISTAKGFPKDRARAFKLMNGIVNDCLVTFGVYYMESTNLNKDKSSVAKINTQPEKYLKYCKNFICDKGLPSFKFEENNVAEDFERYQCGSLYNHDKIKQNLQNEFVEKGTICGKSLDQFSLE